MVAAPKRVVGINREGGPWRVGEEEDNSGTHTPRHPLPLPLAPSIPPPSFIISSNSTPNLSLQLKYMYTYLVFVSYSMALPRNFNLRPSSSTSNFQNLTQPPINLNHG